MKSLLIGLAIVIGIAIGVFALVMLIGFLVRQLLPVRVRHTPRVQFVPRKHWCGREDSPSWERRLDGPRRLALATKLREFAE